MKTYFIPAVIIVMIASASFVKNFQQGYILEHEKDIAKSEAGPHNGGGMSTGYSFFSQAKDLKMAFRKRVLHKGSAIGYHLQKEDEVYYIVSGEGEMKMNDKTFKVKAGDAILTRPGSSHGLQPTGDDDLILTIAYDLN
jgi:mannose-6-phosphate isomerase-like protein (cupin superfamily)